MFLLPLLTGFIIGLVTISAVLAVYNLALIVKVCAIDRTSAKKRSIATTPADTTEILRELDLEFPAALAAPPLVSPVTPYAFDLLADIRPPSDLLARLKREVNEREGRTADGTPKEVAEDRAGQCVPPRPIRPKHERFMS